MKNFRRFCFVVVLSLAFTLPALADGGTTQGPPNPGDQHGPDFTATGDVSTPGVASTGEIGCPGFTALREIGTPGFAAALLLLNLI